MTFTYNKCLTYNKYINKSLPLVFAKLKSSGTAIDWANKWHFNLTVKVCYESFLPFF